MTNAHFLNRYNKIINHYKSVISEGYVEKHHIIPKCMGGSDDISNIVALPVRAHFISHYLLHKSYPENKSLAYAFSMMFLNNPNQKRHFDSYYYEKSKKARSSAMKGRKLTEKQKAKLRVPKKNKENYKGSKSVDHRKNISNALKGKKKSIDHLLNLRESMQNYYDKRKHDTQLKKDYYRNLFVKSSMSRKDFADHHNVNRSTMKSYLRGL